jgi:hypothetical protein
MVANPHLVSALTKLADIGQRAGFSVEEMICILNSGFTVEELLGLIESRLDKQRRVM